MHFSRYPKKVNYFRSVYSLLALTVYSCETWNMSPSDILRYLLTNACIESCVFTGLP